MSFTETYRQVRDAKRFTLRTPARRAALGALSAWDRITDAEKWLRRPRVQVVYIHHVFRDEEAPFRRIVDFLVRHHRPIGYSEAVERVRSGRIDQPYVAFTSDDGLHNVLAACRILEEFGARMCAFVCTDMVGQTDPAAVARFCAERIHMPPCRFLDWADVDALLAAGHEIGSHTRGHVELSSPTVEELRDQISGSRDELERRIGTVRHFAFPYGRFRHLSGRARDVVFEAGYESCATAERGCHVPSGRTYAREETCIRRDHVLAAEGIPSVLHFLVQNARRACPSDALWPL